MPDDTDARVREIIAGCIACYSATLRDQDAEELADAILCGLKAAGFVVVPKAHEGRGNPVMIGADGVNRGNALLGDRAERGKG